MKQKTYENLTSKGKELWLFNKLNDYIYRPDTNKFLAYIIMTTIPMIYSLMIFQLLSYDSGKYVYLLEYFNPLMIGGFIISLLVIIFILTDIIEMIIKFYKERKIVKKHSKK